MSQSGNNLKNMKLSSLTSGLSGTSGMVGGIVFFIILLIILYYVYTFLYSSTAVQSSINLIPSKVKDATQLKGGSVIRCDASVSVTSNNPTQAAAAAAAAATGDSAATATARSAAVGLTWTSAGAATNGVFAPGTDYAVAEIQTGGLTSGGQYTVTMWLSVYSTTPENVGTATTLPLLDITSLGTNPKTQLYIGLMPTNGTLVVNQGTADASDGTVNIFGMTTPASGSQGSATMLKSDKCSIINGIEYQRWVLISVVANGRTLDVYIDGKLSRSCVYAGMNDLGNTTGKGTITVGRQNTTTGSINGVFSTTDYYNYALTPDIIWSIYQAGPATASGGNFLSGLFNTNIDLSMGTANN